MGLARIIHECRREAAETEARRGFSQVRATQAYLRSVEETEREKPRRARGSAAVVGIHEYSGLSLRGDGMQQQTRRDAMSREILLDGHAAAVRGLQLGDRQGALTR